ncbi:MAG: peptide chain release factor N(5)-glutamine methyltransferase [Bdellovibrionota bacterium]
MIIPPHERRILEAHVRGISLNQLALHQDQPLNEYEERELKNLIKLRVRGLPLQYLTGSQDFFGRGFYVNTSVLVPRPETEGLVEHALKELNTRFGHQESLKGLEFGAGSGCISITLTLERPGLKMWATDSSEEALSVCRENSKKLWATNAEFIPVSAEPRLWEYEGLPECDFLISNPPYLLSSDEIANDVRDHEPPEALYAQGEDAVFYYRFLAELIKAKVQPKGFGLFELSESRSAETSQVFADKGYSTQIFQDLTGRDRYILVHG